MWFTCIFFKLQCAYETAKSLVLDEARNCIKNNLYELQKDDRTPRNQELLQGCMMVLSCIEEDERIKKTAINQIHEVTMPQTFSISTYLHTLSYIINSIIGNFI